MCWNGSKSVLYHIKMYFLGVWFLYSAISGFMQPPWQLLYNLVLSSGSRHQVQLWLGKECSFDGLLLSRRAVLRDSAEQQLWGRLLNFGGCWKGCSEHWFEDSAWGLCVVTTGSWTSLFFTCAHSSFKSIQTFLWCSKCLLAVSSLHRFVEQEEKCFAFVVRGVSWGKTVSKNCCTGLLVLLGEAGCCWEG